MSVIIILVLITLGVAYSIILQSIRNKATHKVLGQIDLMAIKNSILAINQNNGFTKTTTINVEKQCPFCKSDLVLTVRRGTDSGFWNCKNPECKYTRNCAKIYTKKTIKRSDKCDFCGGKLNLRNGAYGKFWGCNNYPKCRYTKPAR